MILSHKLWGWSPWTGTEKVLQDAISFLTVTDDLGILIND